MKPINIFISYAHDNRDELRSFTAQLDRYIQDTSINYWTDDEIRAGDKFNKKIYDALKKCDIALFLISHQSVQKFYINKIEIPLAITEANRRGITIIPIYIDKDVDSPVFFRQDILNCSGLPEVNKTFSPVNVFGDKEKIWENIVEHLDGVITSPSFVKYLEERKSEFFSFFIPDNIRTKMEVSIERDKEKELNKWVNNDQSPIAYIEGEEGVGKTILAYQFLNRLSEKGYFTFGFSSIEWQEISSIEEIIKKSFGIKTFDEYHEFFLNFEKPIVILIDGVNEKNTLHAYNRIYLDFTRNQNVFKSNIKLLLTTRSLRDYPDFDPKYWVDLTRIELSRLSDTEFDALLKLCGSDLNSSTFPQNLIHLAKTPRYFAQALKLKGRFGGFENVTKVLLLWEGLKEQIQYDDKFRKILKITSDHDLENKLLDFILHENFNHLSGSIDLRVVKDVFSKSYEEIRIALQEIRLFETHEQRHLKIDTDLVIIGYAACLLSTIREKNILSIEEIADAGKKILEPFSNDHLSNVPKIAFHLSIAAGVVREENTKIHSALLYLWLFNHNSHPSGEDLYEWANYDLLSYISVLDKIAFDRKIYDRYDDLENYLISILGNLWKKTEGQHSLLNDYLIKSFSTPCPEGKRIEQYRIITRCSLILHFYPMENFLDSIANNEQVHFQGNDVFNELMHFGYKEDFFSIIKASNRYSIFSNLYKSHELAEAFGIKLPLLMMQFTHQFFQQLDKLQSYQALLIKYENTSQIDGFRYFAIRLDLALHQNDISSVINNLKQWLHNIQYEQDDLHYPTYLIKEIFPLLARYDHTELRDISFGFLSEYLQLKLRVQEIEYFDRVAFTNIQNKSLVSSIFENKQDFFSIEHQQDLFINKIIELLLCSANSKQVLNFFDYLIETHSFSTIYYKPPILEYIHIVIKEKLLSLVQKKLLWKGWWLKRFNQKKFDCLMTYLYMLGDSSDNLIEWSLQKLKSLTLEKDEIGVYNDRAGDFYRKIIIERSKPSKYFLNIYQDKKLQPFFYQPTSSQQGSIVSFWISQEDNFLHNKTYDELTKILPFDSFGVLLNHLKRFKELERWCDQFFTTKTPRETGEYQIDAVLESLYTHFPEKMRQYSIQYLEKVNLPVDQGGRHLLSYNAVESQLIQLLLSSEPRKAYSYYIKSPISQNIQNKFTNKIFNNTFTGQIHKEIRQEIIQSCKNDLEILYCVNMILAGNLKSEIKEYIDELLKSIYAIDRQLAISYMIWIADDDSIQMVDSLRSSDDSEYVREYAYWAYHVVIQEKYVKQIYEEALITEDLFAVSSKLLQIDEFISPTAYFWMQNLNKIYVIDSLKYSQRKRLFLERFFYRINKKFDSQSTIKVFDRNLKDYFRGERISDYIKFVQKYIG